MGHYFYVHTDPRPPSNEDLNNASISQTGSTVTVKCHPDDETASCVVVYRAYGNSTLNVVDKVDSLTVALETGNYTFAIFRRTSDSDIDERPFISRMIVVDGTSPPKGDFGNIMKLIFMYQQYKLHVLFSIDEPARTSSDGTGVIVGVVLSVLIILSVGVALATVFIVWRKRKVVMLCNITHNYH